MSLTQLDAVTALVLIDLQKGIVDNVTLVVDAMTDRSDEMHRHGVEKFFPRLGETGSTDEVLRLLNERHR